MAAWKPPGSGPRRRARSAPSGNRRPPGHYRPRRPSPWDGPAAEVPGLRRERNAPGHRQRRPRATSRPGLLQPAPAREGWRVPRVRSRGRFRQIAAGTASGLVQQQDRDTVAHREDTTAFGARQSLRLRVVRAAEREGSMVLGRARKYLEQNWIQLNGHVLRFLSIHLAISLPWPPAEPAAPARSARVVPRARTADVLPNPQVAEPHIRAWRRHWVSACISGRSRRTLHRVT